MVQFRVRRSHRTQPDFSVIFTLIIIVSPTSSP